MYQTIPQTYGTPRRKPNLPPPDEGSVQMSPFSDERWDIDAEENRRRREIHRNYVLVNLSKNQKNQGKYLKHPEEPPLKVSILRESVTPPPPAPTTPPPLAPTTQEPVKQPQEIQKVPCDVVKKDIYKPKTWADIKFEKVKPPDLYPLLKFPERRVKPDEIYSMGKPKPNPLVIQVPGRPIITQEVSYEPPPIPQFTPGRSKPEHYGTNLPFWDFSVKGLNK